MEQQTDDSTGTVWAVIDSGTRRLVGKVVPQLAAGDVAEVQEAVEMDAAVTRLPGPGGQMAVLYSPSLIPVDAEDGPVTIDVVIANIRYFTRMADKGNRYTLMYDNLLASITESRAKRAGISLASQMPGQDPRVG